MAEADNWQRYVVTETGASVDLPRTYLQPGSWQPESGAGGKFLTSDSRANLTVQSDRTCQRYAGDVPDQKKPPSGIVYRRVTGRFFVASSFRNGLIWYNRCNFAGRMVTCVLINYPASEKKQWDAVVTRISNSLSKG